MTMHESDSENPFQSPKDVSDASERSSIAARMAIWGTVAVAVILSAGSFLVDPVRGTFVLILSLATIGRTVVVVNRRKRLNQAGANNVLLTAGDSFASMSLLVLGSLLVASIVDGPLIFLCGFFFSPEMMRWIELVIGYSVRGVLFGYGCWVLLKQPELPEMNRTEERLDRSGA